MSLIGNRTLLNRIIGRQFGGGTSYFYREAIKPNSALKNQYLGGVPKFTSTPNGYLAPMAFILPKIAGGMATNNQVQLVVTNTDATLVNAQYIIGTSTITVTNVNAQLGQNFAALASGTISVSQFAADLAALVSGGATGTITLSSLAALGGTFPGEGSSTITVTPLGLLTAIAFMEAEAGGATPLSPEGLAAAVWNAVLSDYQDVGSAGEALSNAGSGGNPWDALLSANNDPGTFGERIQKLLTVAKFLGLK